MTKVRIQTMVELDMLNRIDALFEGKSLNEKILRAIGLGLTVRAEALRMESKKRLENIASAEPELEKNAV